MYFEKLLFNLCAQYYIYYSFDYWK